MIFNRMRYRIAGIFIIASFGVAGSAQSTMNSVRNDSPSKVMNSNLSGWTADMSDEQFARQALESNLAQVELGKLAVQNGSADVKQIGHMMVQDHGKLNDQLKPVAQKIGVSASVSLSTNDQALIASLTSESGKQFDDAYLQAVLLKHRADRMAFLNEKSMGKDQDLKNIATDSAELAAIHMMVVEQVAKDHHIAVPSTTGGPAGTRP